MTYVSMSFASNSLEGLKGHEEAIKEEFPELKSGKTVYKAKIKIASYEREIATDSLDKLKEEVEKIKEKKKEVELISCAVVVRI